MIEDIERIVASLRGTGTEVIAGNGANANILAAANQAEAGQLFVTIPNCFEAGRIVEEALGVTRLEIMAGPILTRTFNIRPASALTP